jgi:hypothetical protein
MKFPFKMAEEVRFELTVPVKGRWFSRPVQSTALPLFRTMLEKSYNQKMQLLQATMSYILPFFLLFFLDFLTLIAEASRVFFR